MENFIFCAAIVLDNLRVDEEKRLKCNAHIILGFDDALENVFRSCVARFGTVCPI